MRRAHRQPATTMLTHDAPLLSRATLRGIPRGVWVLGFVSLLMDVSSEMIHALLPVYLVTVLGASMLAVGWVEGIAEATANIVKVFSGALADRWGRRKPLAALGYGMAALTKPVFALATTVSWLVAARFIDRVGKGIRGAPRDALVADLAPAHLRGAAFGLRQALDTVGAFVGPLLAMVLMWLTANHFQTVFWFAVLPAALAAALIIFGVREPPRPEGVPPVRAPLSRAQLARLGGDYAWVVVIGAVLTLARFSEAFLILRAQSDGLALMWVPLVLVGMNVVYALAAYPLGALSDRMDRGHLLQWGLLILIAADLVLAWWPGLVGVSIGVLLWGLHMAATQGLLAAMVADTAAPDLRGTAFGLFNLVTGVAMLAASLIAGALWDRAGPSATFLAGALFALLAGFGLTARRVALKGRALKGRA